MRSRRPATSLVLIGGAIILLIAIAIGQRLGDSVLRQVTEQRSTEATAILTPVPPAPQPTEMGPVRNWKHEQVVSVATDPAFPDPRATPKPTPRPAPTPVPTVPPPTLPPSENLPPAKAEYTSPPLPLPIASHLPEELDTEPPDANGYPQGIPPVTPEPTPSPP
jgi:hypothetical protein